MQRGDESATIQAMLVLPNDANINLSRLPQVNLYHSKLASLNIKLTCCP